MKLKKMMEQAGDFFSDEKKEKQKKVEELQVIIDELGTKRAKLHQRLKKESNKKLKKDLRNKYDALVKLLHQARKRHSQLS